MFLNFCLVSKLNLLSVSIWYQIILLIKLPKMLVWCSKTLISKMLAEHVTIGRSGRNYLMKIGWNLQIWPNDLVHKVLDSISSCPMLKTNGWLQDQISPFTLPRLIKWVPGISRSLVVILKFPPHSGFVTLRQLNPILSPSFF